MMAQLDDRSRSAAHRFLIRIASLSAVAMVLHLLGSQPFREFPSFLSLTFSYGGVIAAVQASMRQEIPGQGSLNGWDELLAFIALSRLGHLAQGLLV